MTVSIRLLGMACGALLARPWRRSGRRSRFERGSRYGRERGARDRDLHDDRASCVSPSVSISRRRHEGRDGRLPPLDSTSVRLDAQGLRVLRQAYRFDVWDADLVFRRFLGDSIVYRYGGRRYRGVLAGIDGDDLFILRADSADVLTMMKRMQLTEVEFPRARRLRTTPTLEWELDQAKAGSRAGDVSYVTAGLQWTAEYAAVLDKDERGLQLTGWAVIANRSGAAFRDAKVTLVAGRSTGRDSPGPGARRRGPGLHADGRAGALRLSILSARSRTLPGGPRGSPGADRRPGAHHGAAHLPVRRLPGRIQGAGPARAHQRQGVGARSAASGRARADLRDGRGQRRGARGRGPDPAHRGG